MDEDILGGSQDPVLTGVNWLTHVNRASKCIKKIERSRTVGFRLPEPLQTAYLELPNSGKTLVKVVLSSLIYALAKKYGVEIECEEQLKPYISADVPVPSGQIIINANLAEAKAESKTNVNVDLGEIIRLINRLYELRSPLPPLQREIVEKLYKEIRKAIN